MPKNANSGIHQYKEKKFDAINNYLRALKGASPQNNPRGLNPTDHACVLSWLNDIDREMYKNETFFPVLYRGCACLDFGIRGYGVADYTKIKSIIGKTITWWSYTSTSKEKYIAENFARSDDKKILMEINTVPETMLNDLTRYTDLKNTRNEKEVLLARGTRFEVKSVEIRKNRFNEKYVHVVVDLLAPGQ